jgi:hypothetical protein
MRVFVLSFKLVLVSFISIAQSIAPDDIIEIDTITHLPKQSVPFDKPFVFKTVTPANLKPLAYTIEELSRNGRVKADNWRSYKQKYLPKPPKKSYFPNPTDYIHEKKRFKRDKKETKVNFLEHKKYNTTYPVFTSFDKNNQKAINTHRKEDYFHVQPVKPSRNYRMTITYENNEYIEGLIKVIENLDNTPATAEVLYKQLLDKFTHSSSMNFITTFNEFKGLVYSFPLDFSELSSVTAPLVKVFVVKEEDDVNFTVDTACRERNNYSILVQNSSFLLQNNALTSNKELPDQFIIAYSRSYINHSGATITEKLKDTKQRELMQGAKYRIAVLHQDPSLGKTALEKSSILIYKNNRFEKSTNTNTSKIKILNSSVENINDIKKVVEKFNDSLKNLSIKIPSTAIPLATKELLEIDCGESRKLIGEMFCSQKDELVKSYNNLLILTVENIRELAGGIITTTNITKKEDKNNYSNRLANLKSTQKDIERITTHLNYTMATSTSTDLPQIRLLQSTLLDIVNFINNNAVTSLESAIKLQSLVTNQLVQTHRFVKPTSYNSTSEIFKFKTRNSFRIVPDFGLIGVMKGGSHAGFSDISPYLGFNINLRPINKDIPFWSLRRKTPWHYISFMSGITLTPIKIEGQREDLFNIGSLMTGLGIRVNNTAKIAAGAVWFKAYSTNPLIRERKLSFSPYIGLSLDLELQDLFGGLAKLFR